MKTSYPKFFISFLFFLVIGCSENKTEATKAEEIAKVKLDTLAIGKTVYTIQDLTDTNYIFSKGGYGYRDSDDVTIAMFPELVSRNGDSLFLKCDNGNPVKFVNNKSQDDDYVMFNFLELNKDIDYYVVSRLRVESHDFILVNKKSGEPLEAIGYPVVSPGKKFFICPNMDIEAAFTLNGLGLYQQKNNSYVLLGVREIYEWGPEEVMWKNDTTFVIKTVKKVSPDEYRTVYKALYIK